MTRKEQIEKAAQEYINSNAVSPMNMQMAFGDFIKCKKNSTAINRRIQRAIILLTEKEE